MSPTLQLGKGLSEALSGISLQSKILGDSMRVQNLAMGVIRPSEVVGRLAQFSTGFSFPSTTAYADVFKPLVARAEIFAGYDRAALQLSQGLSSAFSASASSALASALANEATFRSMFTVQEGFSQAFGLSTIRDLSAMSHRAKSLLNEWAAGAAMPSTPWLREAPVFEQYGAGAAAVAIGTADATIAEPADVVDRLSQVVEPVHEYIASISKDLVDLHRGAIHAIRAKGPDGLRHFSISLRELLTQVLHHLAPDAELKAWSGASQEDFPQGRPTRAVRIRYIFRRYQKSAYADFAETDAKQILDMMSHLHGNAHRPRAGEVDDGLRLVLRRVEGFVVLLVEASREG